VFNCCCSGLLDDDFGMELLVGNSIVSLALPVNDVVERHWWPRQQQRTSTSAATPAAAAAGSTTAGPPAGVAMPVTFRLSGLDGEATEPLVKDLNPGQSGGQIAEQEQGLAAVLSQQSGRGLGVLLQLLLLAQQQQLQALRWCRGQVLQLLKAAVKLEPCRMQLLQLGALGTLLHLVHLSCKPLLAAAAAGRASSAQQDAAGAAGATAAAAAADGRLGGGMSGAQLLLLLEALEALVTAANTSGQPVLLDSAPAATAAADDAAGAQLQKDSAAAALAAAPAVDGLAPAAARNTATAAVASSSATEVAQLADGLSVLEMAGLGSCAAVLARLLTALAQHSSTAQLGLLQHFAPALDLRALDAACSNGETAAAASAGIRADGAASAAPDPASEDDEDEVMSDDSADEASDGDDAAAAGEGAEGGDVLVLSVVHTAADGVLSAQEHRVQLQGFLRLTEALSSSSSTGSSSGADDSASRRLSITAAGNGSTAAAAAAAGDVQLAEQPVGFKQLVLQQGIPTLLARYLVEVFSEQQQQQQQQGTGITPAAAAAASDASLAQPGSAAWSAAAAKPGVPFALRLLAALMSGHAPTAAALAADAPLLLRLLHVLEGTAGGSTLTPLAEACLEAAAGAGDADVAAAVDALRAATAAEMKARAAKKREALLASLGMVQVEAGAEAGGGFKILPSPGGVPALSPLAAELAALESSLDDEETAGGACMVCREGYCLQPSTLLGCYCYCRVAAAAEWPGCSPPWSTPYDLLFTSVSHFNLIHVSCHAAAKAADSSLRQPKREWQGATLRNGSVLCNALLPLAAPAAGPADTPYAAAVAAFWQQQLAAPSASEAAAAAGGSSGSSGRSSAAGDAAAAAAAVTVSLSRRCAAFRESDSSLLRVTLVAADMATLLRRFAYGLSFSEEARGGGRASNARLLLALLQLGRYFVAEAATDELVEAQQLLTAAGKAAAALGLEVAAAPAAASPAGVDVTPTAAAVGAAGSGASTGASSTAATTAAASCGAEDVSELTSSAAFVLALSLLVSSPAEWMTARRSMLAVAVRHGVARWLEAPGSADAAAGSSISASTGHRRRSSKSGSSSSTNSSLAAAAAKLSDIQLYAAAAPMVRMFGMVDLLQQWAKPAVSSSGSSSSSWSAAMADRLQDLARCSEAAGELVELVDDAESSLGLQDLVDSCSLLGVVLGAAGVDSCEAFVQRACAEV
jgi:hypothetical protein